MLDTIYEWQSPPQMCELSPDAVHVWLADLEHVAPYCRPLARILDRHERDRAAKSILSTTASNMCRRM